MAESGLTEFLQQVPAGIIAMFCLSGIALAVVVVLIGSGRLRGKPRPSAAAPMTRSAADADMPDLDALLRADSTPLPTSQIGGQAVDRVPVLTILRDVTSGGLIAQIGGQTERIGPELRDADFRRKLTGILAEVTQQTAMPVPPAPAAPTPPPTPATPSAPTPPPTPAASSTPAAPSAPAAPVPRSIAFDLPTYSLDDRPTPMTRRDLKKASEEPIPELDIAGRIEAFLQHKLASGVQFTGRSLHVLPAPDGGIRIQVDDRFFDAVDEIDDAEVRAYLQATIQEWQDRQ